jgi:hypothetical protein
MHGLTLVSVELTTTAARKSTQGTLHGAYNDKRAAKYRDAKNEHKVAAARALLLSGTNNE